MTNLISLTEALGLHEYAQALQRNPNPSITLLSEIASLATTIRRAARLNGSPQLALVAAHTVREAEAMLNAYPEDVCF